MAGVGTGSSVDRELAASFSSDTLSNIPVMGLDTDGTREGESNDKKIKKGTCTCTRDGRLCKIIKMIIMSAIITISTIITCFLFVI